MQIIPAIDIRNGKCVRLFQGDYAKETIYSDSPVAMALKWKNQGAKMLHIVDLSGAKRGRTCRAGEPGNRGHTGHEGCRAGTLHTGGFVPRYKPADSE